MSEIKDIILSIVGKLGTADIHDIYNDALLESVSLDSVDEAVENLISEDKLAVDESGDIVCMD